jgi:hypothetical protein
MDRRVVTCLRGVRKAEGKRGREIKGCGCRPIGFGRKKDLRTDIGLVRPREKIIFKRVS